MKLKKELRYKMDRHEQNQSFNKYFATFKFSTLNTRITRFFNNFKFKRVHEEITLEFLHLI